MDRKKPEEEVVQITQNFIENETKLDLDGKVKGTTSVRKGLLRIPREQSVLKLEKKGSSPDIKSYIVLYEKDKYKETAERLAEEIESKVDKEVNKKAKVYIDQSSNIY